MKLKTTIYSMLICLLAFSFSASAQWCGTSANGKYQWRIETKTTPTAQLVITVHPLTLANSTFINFYPETLFGGGYGLTKNGTDWVFTHNGSYIAGAELKFHFLYNGDGIGGQEESESFSYAIGQDCSSSVANTLPEVEVSNIAGANGFVSPETVTITATATDPDTDGSITKVEFYNGATKIGETLKANAVGDSYNFVWANVQPGNYSITAKATDDKFGVTTSDPVPFTVTGEFTQEWCGQSAGAGVPTTGDEFEWRAETAGNGDVVVTFHGIGGAEGSTFAIVNGAIMTDAGSGNLTSTIAGQTSGASLELKFTYARPIAGGENNNNGNPVTYVVGSQCSMSTLPVSLISFKSKVQADGTVSLNWATASETNNNHFIVERSIDNQNFAVLSNLASKGTDSKGRLNYDFTDKNPANGTNYYRLTQVDNNGKSLVLGIVAETVSLSSLSGIYPNPLLGSTLNLSLANQADGQVVVNITSPAGKVVYSNAANVVGGQASISLASKPAPGFYIVKVADKSFKLIIQ